MGVNEEGVKERRQTEKTRNKAVYLNSAVFCLTIRLICLYYR